MTKEKGRHFDRALIQISTVNGFQWKKHNRENTELKELQELVGGYIEVVPTWLGDDWAREEGVGLVMIVDEEGKLKGKPINSCATEMLANNIRDVIVGDAVIAGVKDDEIIALKFEAVVNIIERFV